MKKYSFLFFFKILFVCQLNAQSDFYFDNSLNALKCEFTNDAIYFYGGSSLSKSDYAGNVAWTKSSVAFSRLIIKGDVIYSTDGINIYKLDTSGNGIWVKNFSVPMNPANPFGNSISDILFDGERIFVSINQCPSMIPFDPITQAQILLDTAGNILNVVCDTNFVLTQSRIGKGSLKNGGWLALYDLSGSAHGSIVARIDSNGNFLQSASSINFSGIIAEIQEIIPMADSTYLIVCNENGPYAQFTCAKVTESGNIIWSSTYRVEVAHTHAYYFTSDSLNNIYILGYASLGWDFIPILIKLSSTGDVLISRSWSYANYGTGKIDFGHGNNYFYNGMYFRNNLIYCVGTLLPNKTSILVFDTLLQNSCYTLIQTW
jgi:hypothetical protein